MISTRTLRRLLARSTGAGVLSCLLLACAEPGDLPSLSETGTTVEGVRPRRIVSLMPAATEILFALGAGDRLVGRTRWGVHPAEAASIPDVGDGVRPSLEVVMSRDPDLVVLFEGQDTEGAAERLRTLGVETLALRHNTLGDLERNILALGDAVGCPNAAHDLRARVAADLDRVSAAVTGLHRVRAYYDVWTDPPMTIGRGSFLDSLLTIAGGENVFGDLGAPSPEIGLETVVLRDPDVIVHPVSRAPDAVDDRPAARQAWQAVRAVSEGRIVIVDADLLGRLGPRVGQAALELAGALHPEADLPEVFEPVASPSCAS